MDAQPLSAGELRHRLIVQVPQEVRDEQGGFTERWVKVVSRWAKVEPLRGSEFFQAAQTDARVTHKVSCRPYPGLSAKHRFLWGERVLNISVVLNPEERSLLMEILAIEDV